MIKHLIILASLLLVLSSFAVQAQDQIIVPDDLEGLPENIALTISNGQYQHIGLYNWRTGDIEILTDSGSRDGHSAWSPDASQLIFQTDRDGQWELYLYDFTDQTERNVTNHPASDMYPNWTPDGRIVHFSDRSGEAALWLTDPTDGNTEGLTHNDDCRPDYHPNFAPDGTAVAYRADCSGNGDIWHFDLETGERVNLTASSGATDRYPAWSPDGSQLLFVSSRDGNEEVYVMKADGSDVRNLTSNPARDGQGSWSPDGHFIIFTSDRNGSTELWIMDADGSRPTRLLASNDEFIGYDWPWWQPEEQGMGNADVEYVRAEQSSDGAWRFSVTVRHPDTGWEDYADGWDVVLPDGTVIKPDPDSPFTRLLLHPHETEQPFTRSQNGIIIPDGVTTVVVRAHDLVDGWGGQTVTVDLTQTQGENYEVQAYR